MNLRAQNLMIFLQIAEGIDDRTWEHHLRKGDYSEWFRRPDQGQGARRGDHGGGKGRKALAAGKPQERARCGAQALYRARPPPRRKNSFPAGSSAPAKGLLRFRLRPSRKWWISRTGAERTFGYVSTGSAESRHLQAGLT